MLRATTACNFSSLICPYGPAPAALESLPFDLRSHKTLVKTECFAALLHFRAPASSSSSHSFSSLILSLLLFSDSSHPCFSICPCRWKFDFCTSFDNLTLNFFMAPTQEEKLNTTFLDWGRNAGAWGLIVLQRMLLPNRSSSSSCQSAAVPQDRKGSRDKRRQAETETSGDKVRPGKMVKYALIFSPSFFVPFLSSA